MGCISSVSYVIMINGSPTKSFRARKGLRQGDPLSSFLFALTMEYFSRSLKGIDKVGFEYHSRCHKVELKEMMFADDLLIFAKGTVSSARIIAEKL